MLSNHKSYAKIALTITMLLTILLLAISCKECPSEPKPEPEYNIYLSVEYVLCTWVTLKVTLPDSGKINSFSMDRNDSTIATYTSNDNDTLITDEGLTPDTDFSYKVRFLKDGKIKSESEPVTVHTMPTTSHNFVWEIDTLGNYGSYLNDVWIIDENDIWVVAYLRVDDPDSSFDGTGQETFNAARWDGEKWNLMLIVNPDPLYSIFYFNENDMWMSNGLPIHWDGNNWTLYHIQQMGISANVEYGIWGTSSLDIYFVGRFGSIVHYNGSTFRKIESGTDIGLTDIYGYLNSRIFICGYNRTDGRCILLSGDHSGLKKIYESDDYDYYGRVELSSVFQSVWIYDNQLYIATSAGFWHQSISSKKGLLCLWTEVIENRIWPNCIRGTAHNNIFIVSDKGDVIHFNGVTFENYIGTQGIEYGPPQLYFVDCKDDLVVACGVLNSTYQGIVYKGRQ